MFWKSHDTCIILHPPFPPRLAVPIFPAFEPTAPSFDIPSDSALRSFSASAFRNFQITVTGLAREARAAPGDRAGTRRCFVWRLDPPVR